MCWSYLDCHGPTLESAEKQNIERETERKKRKERKREVHTWIREKVLCKDEERNPSTYSSPGIV